MTVAVRALATGELGAINMARVVLRETATGLINGLAFALIMGLITFFWFGSNRLGAVIGAAMVINLLAAAIAGIFIPLGLQRWGFDPAVSSTVFVTNSHRRGGLLRLPGAGLDLAHMRGADVDQMAPRTRARTRRPLPGSGPFGVGAGEPPPRRGAGRRQGRPRAGFARSRSSCADAISRRRAWLASPPQHGNEWRLLAGGRAAPYECRIGDRSLRIDAVRTYFDANGHKLGQAANELLFNKARYFREGNFRWTWSP